MSLNKKGLFLLTIEYTHYQMMFKIWCTNKKINII